MVRFLILRMKRRFLSKTSSVIPLKMITFCKSVDCPTSQDLLAFQEGEALLGENEEIRRHLDSCEFCAAELEFYEHFPQGEETAESTEIPQPLLQLAEALLGSRRKKFSLLNKLLNENKGLSVI